jgi:radical SAM superfamily enzyme YgiQ (UPF0313 family)
MGGPEVSYNAPEFLKAHPQVTGIMVGEGEKTFLRLLEYYVDGIGSLEEIPGIFWQDAAGLQCGQPPEEPMKTLDEVPFVYGDLSGFEHRIIYYESSRGCPFSCSYCLSSIDKRVRFRSLELVREELGFFLKNRVPQVKFVDRTFNCNHAHAMEIWRYILEHDNGVTNFHFEIAADLLNEEEISLLSRMRPGLVQLEIGVQTTNEQALAAIHRSAKFEKIAGNVRKVAASHNIHQHLDLIAGLPYEDFESFRNSFNDVYALHPQELQLGFLKVLRGSEMHRRAKEYGIVYRSRPTYEVLATQWISCAELLRLKEIEEMLEVYYNSRQFDHTVFAMEQSFDSAFDLYASLADHYKEKNLEGKAYSRMQRFEILRDFIGERVAATAQEREKYDELLILDLYLRENAKSRPQWAPDYGSFRDQIAEFYRREESEHGYLPDYESYTWKQMMRMTHVERFAADGTEEWYLFDYGHRDPLTNDARRIRICLQ